MRRRAPRQESFAGMKAPDYSSLLVEAQKKAKEVLMLEAIKEAFTVIRGQNHGNCISSVIHALEVVAPEWLRRKGWKPQ